jgi:flagellar motility protein MotE (MotC chaperone)
MRLRLLPVLMFALVAMMTVKVGSVWNAFEVSIGTETLAQGEASGEPAATPAGEAKPVEQTAAEQPAAAEGAAPAEATGQQAATAPEASASKNPMTEEEAAAAAAAAEAAQEPEIDDPYAYTDEEVDVLQQLAKRREELDLRARQLDEREALIQAAEQRMEQKMAELKALQATVEDLLKARSDEEEAELKSLVKMYENMKPKAAAKVFEEMDMDVLLDVVDRMNERKVAPILALVTPTRAKEITFELAQRRQLPMPE